MPFTQDQHRLFEWAAHNPAAAKAAGYQIPQQSAAKMAGEGIIPQGDKRKTMAALLARGAD